MKYIIHLGELDPKLVRLRIDATGIADDDRVIPDMTDVTDVSIAMRDKRSGATETWTTSITEQTEDLLVADHPLEETDTESLRTLRAVVWATVAGETNPVRLGDFELQIVE